MLNWKMGDKVSVYLDLEENFVFFFVNGIASTDGKAFVNLPKENLYFYFSGCNEESSKIIDSRLYISEQSDLYKELIDKIEGKFIEPLQSEENSNQNQDLIQNNTEQPIQNKTEIENKKCLIF
jgi:hypothetical protein